MTPTTISAHIRYLASPELKGRATGSPEIEKAAHYIAKHFKDDHLRPLEGDSYLQPFPVTTSARLGKANNFTFDLQRQDRILQAPTGLHPLQLLLQR